MVMVGVRFCHEGELQDFGFVVKVEKRRRLGMKSILKEDEACFFTERSGTTTDTMAGESLKEKRSEQVEVGV